jgi:hypothetical protein
MITAIQSEGRNHRRPGVIYHGTHMFTNRMNTYKFTACGMMVKGPVIVVEEITCKRCLRARKPGQKRDRSKEKARGWKRKSDV